MKVILILASALISASVSATTLTITSNEKTEKQALQPLAAQLVSTMHNMGAPFVDLGNGVYTMGIRGLHCDEYYNTAIDPERPEFMIPDIKCRGAAKNEKDTTTGTPFHEALPLRNVLNDIQNAATDSAIYFVDCAMGYCGTYAKTVECWIDTKIVTQSEGRFRCRLDDGN